jgi:hypothetical protein
MADRLERGMALLLSALVSVSCTAGGGTTAPSEAPALPPLSSIQGWTGSARATANASQESRHLTFSFEGSATWQKDDAVPGPEDLPLRPGFVRYRLVGGLLHVVASGQILFPVGGGIVACDHLGAVDVVPQATDQMDDPDVRSFLDVGPDGTYVGAIHRRTTVAVVRTCNNGFTDSFNATDSVDLTLRGAVTTARRLQGNMPPDTSGGITTTGSWDFGPR